MRHKLKAEMFFRKINLFTDVQLLSLTPILSFVGFHLKAKLLHRREIKSLLNELHAESLSIYCNKGDDLKTFARCTTHKCGSLRKYSNIKSIYRDSDNPAHAHYLSRAFILL